ncbi:MAG: methylmalonyl-CoA mutase family protein [Halobacteria archaeon]
MASSQKPPAGAPERRFVTLSGLPVKQVYLPGDVRPGLEERVGKPGEFPFTRGIHPTMYRGRLWTMRQYSGYASAEETNKRYRYLLEQGQTGLSVAFDLPTQLGYDPDDPRAEGEVGKAGVSIATLKDMERLFDKIPLDKVSTSMTINAPAAMLLGFYAVVGEKQGVPMASLSGTVQNDLFKEYIARKNYIFPPAPSLRLITDIFEFTSKRMPKWNSISISGYHIREAGSTAAQEIAFTLADGMAYVEAALERGLQIDDFAPRLSFFFNAHLDFFEEVAKFRAARRMWAHIMRERYGANDPRSWMVRFHTQTAGCSLTAQQPENNLIRTTIEGLSAVLGGTQSLHTNAMDEALALPTEKAARLALRTQQVIGYESGVVNTVDPLAGSYFVENLTDEVEAQAWGLIRHIEKEGGGAMLKGVIKCIESGWFQREIAEASYRYQREVESGQRVVVGVNAYREGDGGEPPEILRVDETVRGKRAQEMKQVRKHRDAGKAERALANLRKAAETPGVNLMEPILECTRAYVSVGEMCGTLREVFGEYREAGMI